MPPTTAASVAVGGAASAAAATETMPQRPPSPTLTGIGVGRGCLVAPVAQLHPAPLVPSDEPAPADVAAATASATSTLQQISSELAAQGAGGPFAAVLSATAAMAADPALLADVSRRIAGGTGPVTAIDAAIEGFVAQLTAIGGYMAERATDLRSVRDRAVARLLGAPDPGLGELREPSVVVALDLSPADTAALDLTKVAAIVTEQGGPTGHTAIIAGQLGIPCLVRVAGATGLPDGQVVGIDAAAGLVIIDPTEQQRVALLARAAAELSLADDTAPGATADGHPVALLANIGTVEDAHRAAASAAEGIGLFRTEVLFLGRATAPTVEEQTAVYREVLAALGDRKVVVRTLDAGADKPLAFAAPADEENPALGVRGFRLARTQPELIDTQLAALGAAGGGPRLWTMAPMVATADEARNVAARAHAAGLTTVGVMVEVPAAALRAEAILAEVDFVSVGTNDLAQYTMATDRLRGELADLLSPWQPAVLDLVAATASAGARAGKPVGVCGESASDPLMALVLAGLGVTSLSMSPAAIPAVRFALRRHTLAQCQAIAAAAVAAADHASARAAAVALTSGDVVRGLGITAGHPTV